MVYDAVIDDVSVVGNYRAQFARILHQQAAKLRETADVIVQQGKNSWVCKRSDFGR